MAHIVADRIRETSTTTGTGTYNLDGAVVGFQDFDAACASSDTIFYFASRGTDWEVGLGTFTAGSPDTLARTTIYASTNGGSAVNWGVGIKDIVAGIPARFVEILNTIEETVADSATPDIGAVNGLRILLNGTTTVTSLGTARHKLRIVRFASARQITHNGTSLILPGAVNLRTSAGDVMMFASDGSGNWRCLSSPIQRVVTQIFVTSGTYTPTVGMKYAIIECVAGGGGGGGVDGATSFQLGGGGGGSGSYSRKWVTAADIGASQSVTIGAGGNGGAAGAVPGAAGGDTSVGSLCIAKGGSGGGGTSSLSAGAGGARGVAGTGDFTPVGNDGGNGMYFNSATTLIGNNGGGGASVFGGAPRGVTASGGANAGLNADNYGSGGGGAFASNVTADAAGGNGSNGIVIITEFCS